VGRGQVGGNVSGQESKVFERTLLSFGCGAKNSVRGGPRTEGKLRRVIQRGSCGGRGWLRKFRVVVEWPSLTGPKGDWKRGFGRGGGDIKGKGKS